MKAAGHMQPPMHHALILGNLSEYRNKYSAADTVGVFSTTFTYAPGKLLNSAK